MDCGTTQTPLHEVDLKQSLDALDESAVAMVDLDAIEDKEARDKAVKKRLESDKKKAQKVKEAEEKKELREKERLERAGDKGKSKGKRKVGNAAISDSKSPLPNPSPVDSSSRPRTVVLRSAVADSTYEPLSQVPVLAAEEEDTIEVDEFILNSSLDDVLGGDSGILPPSYDDLKLFLSKVCNSTSFQFRPILIIQFDRTEYYSLMFVINCYIF